MSALLAPFRWAGLLIGDAWNGFLANHPWRWISGVVVGVVLGCLFQTFNKPHLILEQRGFRGVGMAYIYNTRVVDSDAANNRLIEPYPPVRPAGITSAHAYKNIQVLKDVDANEFLRLMATLPTWIAPATGCAFCHSTVNMADDALYTKAVARRMIQMTQDINANWKNHVGNVGVTCNTCHRGRAVPQQVWFSAPGAPRGVAETNTGYGGVSTAAATTSLQSDPYTNLLLRADPVRITGTTALPAGNRQSIQQTDQTYALMAHFAHSLGVGCTYCHNSRDFSSWDQGTPARQTAWYGIVMVRDLNNRYMVPLTGTFPRASLGPTGDVAKINCGTCHQGAYQPLYGASDLAAYPELIGDTASRQASLATPLGATP